MDVPPVRLEKWITLPEWQVETDSFDQDYTSPVQVRIVSSVGKKKPILLEGGR